ncbi:MAG: T9SS type A sorting domain-containing protein, partial [Bacteroidetes bacterium]|nr:T9SS type A sorting domain-containing protein [Bacteroidota bacterium]
KIYKSVPTGQAPLRIVFEDQTNCNVHQRKWNFWGGQAANDTAKQVEVYYEVGGDYQVELFVYDTVANIFDSASLVLSLIPQSVRNHRANKIEFFPNPASTLATYKSDLNFANYSIYNASGALVKNGILNHHEIPVHDLPAGSYYVKLVGNQMSFIGKLQILR